MIKYIKGDLLETTAPIIVHGCNCQGVMGGGVALQIRDKFPKAFEIYSYYYKTTGLALGKINYAYTNNKYIINAMTQEYYGGYKNIVYVDYKAIRECFKTIAIEFKQFTQIAMPKIGCGLANGDWNIVSQIIEEELINFEVLVYEL